MVNALDSGSSLFGGAGSNPVLGTSLFVLLLGSLPLPGLRPQPTRAQERPRAGWSPPGSSLGQAQRRTHLGLLRSLFERNCRRVPGCLLLNTHTVNGSANAACECTRAPVDVLGWSWCISSREVLNNVEHDWFSVPEGQPTRIFCSAQQHTLAWNVARLSQALGGPFARCEMVSSIFLIAKLGQRFVLRWRSG